MRLREGSLEFDRRRKMWRKTDQATVETNMALPAAESPPEILGRREPANLLKKPKRPGMRIAEIVGGKTAECAAILCCCPCGLANLVILAAVRLPAGLFRQAVRKRILIRRAKKRAELIGSGSGSGSDGRSGSGSSKAGSPTDDDDFAEFTDKRGGVMMVYGDRWPARPPAAEVMELEKEMLSKFYSSGFWRSMSQKDAH